MEVGNADSHQASILLLKGTESFRLERELWRSSIPASLSSRVSCSRLPRPASRWRLSISKHGDSTASLGYLFQHLTTPADKKVPISTLKWSFLYFSVSLSFHCALLRRACLLASCWTAACVLCPLVCWQGLWWLCGIAGTETLAQLCQGRFSSSGQLNP